MSTISSHSGQHARCNVILLFLLRGCRVNFPTPWVWVEPWDLLWPINVAGVTLYDFWGWALRIRFDSLGALPWDHPTGKLVQHPRERRSLGGELRHPRWQPEPVARPVSEQTCQPCWSSSWTQPNKWVKGQPAEETPSPPTGTWETTCIIALGH